MNQIIFAVKKKNAATKSKNKIIAANKRQEEGGERGGRERESFVATRRARLQVQIPASADKQLGDKLELRCD